MSGEERRKAAVDVQPRLLADALRLMLNQRGIDVAPEGPRGPVDLVVTDRPEGAGLAHIVIQLPQNPGDVGSVRVDGVEVDVQVVNVADLDIVLERYLDIREGE
jgi:hypothetical protein